MPPLPLTISQGAERRCVLARTNFFILAPRVFPFSQFSPHAFPPPHPLINNGAIGDRALFCHLTFPPPTQRQTAWDASSGTDYSWSAICMKKTSMAAAALLNSIIQLSPHIIKRRALFCSASSLTALYVTSPSPEMASGFTCDTYSRYRQRYFL